MGVVIVFKYGKQFRFAPSFNNQISPKIYFLPPACLWLSKLGGDTSILELAGSGRVPRRAS